MNFFQSLFRQSDNNKGFGYNQLFLGKNAEYISTTGNEFKVYQTNAILRAVIDRKASMFANGIIKHYNKNGEEIENSPFVNFFDKPNFLQSRNEWLMQLKVQECLYGNAFIYKYNASLLKETPQALWNLSPSRMIVNRTGKLWKQLSVEDVIKNYEFENDSTAKTIFEPLEILHRTMTNPDDPLIGISPLKSLEKEITNINLAMDYRNVIMDKKGAIDILSNSAKDSDGGIPLSKEERQRLERDYSNQYGISQEKSKVIITNSALTWSPMTYPTKDLMLFEEIDNNKRAIIDTYGLNENIFSRSQGATFTNVREGVKLAYQDTIIPEAEDLAKGLSDFLGLSEKGECLEISYEHIQALGEDESEKATVIQNKANAIQSLKATGLYTDEEIKDIIEF